MLFVFDGLLSLFVYLFDILNIAFKPIYKQIIYAKTDN